MTIPRITGVDLAGDESLPLVVVGPALGTGVTRAWAEVAQNLGADFHVVGWNLPGHDGAPAAEPYTLAELAAGVAAFLDGVRGTRQHQGPYLYAGVGGGGMVGLVLAATAPANMAALVTLGCTARGVWAGPTDEDGESAGASAPPRPIADAAAAPSHSWQLVSWSERAASVRASGTPSMVTSAAATWFTPGFLETRPSAVSTLLDGLQHTAAEGYALACEAIAGADLDSLLPAVAVPVVSAVGAEDQVTPAWQSRRIAERVPHGRFEIIDHAAHLPSVERPDAVAQVLRSAWADSRSPAEAPEPVPPQEGQATSQPHAPAGSARSAGSAVPSVPPVPQAPGDPGAATLDDVHAAGMQVRREVLGDAHVDRAVANTTPFTEDFQEFITRYAWGTVWTRPGLDRRSRSMITLTAMIARGHHEEFSMHVRAALRNGLTPEEIQEVILHSSIYLGVPDANTAFRLASAVLAEEGLTG